MGTHHSTPSERSHFTRAPSGWVAGTSDIGMKHRTNQDALCLAVREVPERVAVLAVSDGVSTAHGSEVASLVASETAVATLIDAVEHNTSTTGAFTDAFHDAHQAVLDAVDEHEAPSACTLIAAIATPELIIVGNVGDSRAYWFGDDGSAQLLSTDDSMAQARMMLGMSRQEAEQSNQAHSITKWLGRDATNVSPTLSTHAPSGNGWLLLCTDGLWNYASDVHAMKKLVAAVIHDHPAPEKATEAFVAWANEQGGRDNITVALARHEQ